MLGGAGVVCGYLVCKPKEAESHRILSDCSASLAADDEMDDGNCRVALTICGLDGGCGRRTGRFLN